jgi:hypothetical protein
VFFALQARPNTAEPFPELFYSTSDDHEKNRIRRCLFCVETDHKRKVKRFRQIGRNTFYHAFKRFKVLHLRDNAVLLERVKLILPEYTFDNFAAPTSVCLSCSATLMSNTRTLSQKKIADSRDVMCQGRRSRSSVDKCSRDCRICTDIKDRSLKLHIPSPIKRPPRTEVSPAKHRATRPGQNVRGKKRILPEQPALNFDDLSEWRRGASTRFVASRSDRQRKRAKLGHTGISSVSSSVFRRDDYFINSAFLDDYKTVRYDGSSDGGATFVVDVAEMVRKIIWVSCEEVLH